MTILDAVMDQLWLLIVRLFSFLGHLFFSCTSLFHFLGAAATLFVVAFFTVLLTKFLNRVIITKRFVELEKQFLYWKELREYAVSRIDGEKGKCFARNIDRAELNKAYYDYFFEGLMLGIARKVIPIIFIVGFINEFYSPQALTTVFGYDYVFAIPQTPGSPLLIGAIFWYILCLPGCYILWAIGVQGVQFYKRKYQRK